jgi:hypothetical protein
VPTPPTPVPPPLPVSVIDGLDEEIPISDDTDAQDDFSRAHLSDDVVMNQAGQIFERPDPDSPRYGALQIGDKVSVLNESKNRNWINIRLKLTGEEGWVPRSWLVTGASRNALSAGQAQHLLTAELAWGTADHNFGFGLGYFYTLHRSKDEHGLLGNRLELGSVPSYFGGATTEVQTSAGTFNYSVKYMLLPLMLRFSFYLGATQDWALVPEAGVFYQKALINASALPADALAKLSINDNPSSFGLLGGIRSAYLLSKYFQCSLGIRGYLMNESFLSYDIGIGYLF